jgi:phosphoglycerate dehydrogenase-like enzyme
MHEPFTIWSNAGFPKPALDLLQLKSGNHRLVFATQTHASVLAAGGPDPQLAQADIAFGQPDPRQIIESPKVKWVHVTSAGYTRYDTPAFREAMKKRGGVFTNSSAVYSEPCAEHVVSMMYAFARQLPWAWSNQHEERGWPQLPLRADCALLEGQSVLLYSMGSIARRLIELLAPLRMKITGVRQKVRGDEPVPTVTTEQADGLLGSADHIIDILPESRSTTSFFNSDRFAKMKSGAIFYNIGRGSTVDQDALIGALHGKLRGAYLDVMTPEPLPADHPLWKVSNCYITPHSAGGHATEFDRLVTHFLDNLRRYESGQPLKDVIT